VNCVTLLSCNVKKYSFKQRQQLKLFQSPVHFVSFTNKMKTLGVVLDSRLTFESHVSSVIQSCNYHVQAIRQIRDLLDQSMAQKLACSLIISRLETGLLQLASVWCPNRGGVEAAAPAEQRCPYCPQGRSTM